MTSIHNFDSLVDRVYNDLQSNPKMSTEAVQKNLRAEIDRSSSGWSRFWFCLTHFTTVDSRIQKAVRIAQSAIQGYSSLGPYLFSDIKNHNHDPRLQNRRFEEFLEKQAGQDRTPAKVGQCWADYGKLQLEARRNEPGYKQRMKAYREIANEPPPPTLNQQFQTKYPNAWKEFQSILSQKYYYKLKTGERAAVEVFRNQLQHYSEPDFNRILEFIKINTEEEFKILYSGLWNDFIKTYARETFNIVAEDEGRSLEKIYDRLHFFNNRGRFHLFLRDKKGFTDQEIDTFLDFAKTQPKPAQAIQECSGFILRRPPVLETVFGPLYQAGTLDSARQLEEALKLPDAEIPLEMLERFFRLSEKIKEQEKSKDTSRYLSNPLLSAHLPRSIQNCIRQRARIHELAQRFVVHSFEQSISAPVTSNEELLSKNPGDIADEIFAENHHRIYLPFIQDRSRSPAIFFQDKDYSVQEESALFEFLSDVEGVIGRTTVRDLLDDHQKTYNLTERPSATVLNREGVRVLRREMLLSDQLDASQAEEIFKKIPEEEDAELFDKASAQEASLAIQRLLSSDEITSFCELFAGPWAKRKEFDQYPVSANVESIHLIYKPTISLVGLTQGFAVSFIADIHLNNPSNPEKPILASRKAVVTYFLEQQGSIWVRSEPKVSFVNENGEEDEAFMRQPMPDEDEKELDASKSNLVFGLSSVDEGSEEELGSRAEAMEDLMEDEDVREALERPSTSVSKAPVSGGSSSAPAVLAES